MFEIKWERISSLLYEYRHERYVFKRKGKEGAYKYELWENGRLLDNTLDRFGVLTVIRGGYNKLPEQFR